MSLVTAVETAIRLLRDVPGLKGLDGGWVGIGIRDGQTTISVEIPDVLPIEERIERLAQVAHHLGARVTPGEQGNSPSFVSKRWSSDVKLTAYAWTEGPR